MPDDTMRDASATLSAAQAAGLGVGLTISVMILLVCAAAVWHWRRRRSNPAKHVRIPEDGADSDGRKRRKYSQRHHHHDAARRPQLGRDLQLLDGHYEQDGSRLQLLQQSHTQAQNDNTGSNEHLHHHDLGAEYTHCGTGTVTIRTACWIDTRYLILYISINRILVLSKCMASLARSPLLEKNVKIGA